MKIGMDIQSVTERADIAWCLSPELCYHVPVCDVRQLPSPHETPGAVNIDAVSNRIFSSQLSEKKEPFMLLTDTEASGSYCCLDLGLISFFNVLCKI